jgi:dolichol kinase
MGLPDISVNIVAILVIASALIGSGVGTVIGIKIGKKEVKRG